MLKVGIADLHVARVRVGRSGQTEIRTRVHPVPRTGHAIAACGNPNQVEADLGKDVDIVGVGQIQVMPECRGVDVLVAKLFAQFLAAVLVDPDGQQLVDVFAGNASG